MRGVFERGSDRPRSEQKVRVRAVQSDECGFDLHGIADPSRSLNFRAKVTVAAEEEKKLIMDQDSLHGGHVAVYRQTRVC